MLCKLKNYFGIRGKSLNLLIIKSYLTNRRQYTKILNNFSDELETNCRVPQGSCLGPLFISFSLYHNDLPLASQMNTTLYADDTYLMMSDLNLTSLQNRINIELKNIDFWLRKNKLSLNFSKSTFLLIHKQPSRTIKSTFEIKINDIMLTRSPIVKYLGLFIDQNLNWIPHVKSLSFHLARYTGLFYTLKLYTNMDTMKLLYHSLINSKLQYGIIVWGATFKTYLSEVNVRINRIIRALSSSNLYTPMSSLYKKLNLLKLEDLYKVELGKFMYLYYNKKTPKIFNSFFKKITEFTLTIQDKYLTLRFFYRECQNMYSKLNFVQRYKDLVKTKTRVEKLTLECI